MIDLIWPIGVDLPRVFGAAALVQTRALLPDPPASEPPAQALRALTAFWTIDSKLAIRLVAGC
jgi:hypothetical protein